MIGTQQLEGNTRAAVFLLVAVAIALCGAMLAHKLSLGIAVASVLAIILFTFSFVSTEIALYMLIFSMLLGPQLSVGGGDEVTAARGRGVALRADDILIAVIGLSWFLRVAINKELGFFLRTPLNVPIAVYFLICIVATVHGYYLMRRLNPMVGFFFILKYFEYFLIYFMAVNHLREKEQIRRFLIAMLAVCFCVCVFAISQIPYVERVSAPFEGEEGEPNTLGGYLVLMLCLVISLLVTPKSIGKKPLLIVLLGLMLVSLAATLSRGSWVALPPAILALVALSRNRLLIVIPLVIALAVSPYVLPKSVTDRVNYTFNQPENDEQLKIGAVKVDSSTSARLISWKVILTQDFVHHPIIGWGVTGHSFVDAQIPRILIETGLLGLTAFFVLIALLFRHGLRALRVSRDPLFEAISVGYLAGLVGLLVHSVGANTFIIVRIMEPFWFLTALIVMIPRFEGAEGPGSVR
ncbi:MAG: O-antigen ligase family protein [Syntrophales bacterium]|jgi:O-antigen ligase|nr:O-antigen ligase family protein [Syntrophales bacterium]MCU0583313.1 O-antigen ligase family protein [Syntrophales bacterium]